MKDWAHVVTSTRGHWLPGDARGFRNRGARAVSTGHYKDPPPAHEHAGLRRYASGLLGTQVALTPDQRQRVGVALCDKLSSMGIELAILACGAMHTHLILRVGRDDAIALVGRAKQFASHQLRAEIPSKLWGASSHPERIASGNRFWESARYVADHAKAGAWVWMDDRVRAGLAARPWLRAPDAGTE